MKKILPFIFCIAVSTAAHAQIMFQKTFGTALGDYGGSVEQTLDGGYIVAGSCAGYACLVKFDASGALVWNKTYNAGDIFFIRETYDGGYVFTGSEYPIIRTLLGRTDSAGNLLWTKEFDAPGDDWGFGVTLATDSGFVFTGSSGQDVIIFKTDPAGNMLWSNKFDAGDFEEGMNIQTTLDGGYVIAAYSGSNALVIKTNSTGTPVWSKIFTGFVNEWATSIEQTNDGGYIIAGGTESFGAGDEDVLLIKIDDSGNVIWSKAYGNTGWDFAQTVHQTTDGGYVAIGCMDYGSADVKIYAVKTDSAGNLQWSKTYGGPNLEVAWRNSSGYQASDGGYIIGGSTASFGAGGRDMYLIKTDADGNTGCHENGPVTITTTGTITTLVPSITVSTAGIVTQLPSLVSASGSDSTLCFNNFPTFTEEPATEKNIIIAYPNPVTDNMYIQLPGNNCKLEITDSLGQIIYSEKMNAEKVQINMSNFRPGIYFLRIEKNGDTKTEKISVIK